MLIWYRADLTQSITLIITGTFYIWSEIQKEMILTERNVPLCVTCIPSLESPYFNEDIFSTQEGEINHFQAQGHALVCGDLNARTGQEPDTLSTQGDNHLSGGKALPPPHAHLGTTATT